MKQKESVRANRVSVGAAFAFLAIAAIFPEPSQADDLDFMRATVRGAQFVRAIDGDTILVKISGTQHRVRLGLIDTPELHFAGADGRIYTQGASAIRAKEALEALIPSGSRIHIVDYGSDRFGRILGRVFYEHREINLLMVESGWAYPYVICDSRYCSKKHLKKIQIEKYLRACRRARSRGAGLFQSATARNGNAQMPFEFRMDCLGERPSKWVGEWEAKALYPPEDYADTDPCNRIYFERPADAYEAGFM